MRTRIVNQYHPRADRFLLSLPKEFSFREVLRHISRSSLEILHHVEEGKILKLFYLHNTYLLIEVSQLDPSHLQLRFVNQRPQTEQTYNQVVRYVQEWLDLDTNLGPFYALAEDDPLLEPLVKRYHGLRIIGIPDLFEALAWAVIGQQIHLTFAYQLKKRFIEELGQSYHWQGRQYWLFPKPSELDESVIPRLRALQFSQRKAEYIVGIAQAINRGDLAKETLSKDIQRAEQQLCTIRGVGPWTAHYAMMLSSRHPRAFPIGDAGLHNALKHVLHREDKPTLEEIRQIFSRWKDWEAYAVFYLWRSLQDV